MCSQNNPTLRDSALDDGSSELPAETAVLKLTEATSDCADTDFLQGYISEQDYARRRGVTLRTCQRDRQLRRAPPYIQFGRRIFYRVDAVRAWLVNNEHLEDKTPASLRRRRF